MPGLISQSHILEIFVFTAKTILMPLVKGSKSLYAGLFDLPIYFRFVLKDQMCFKDTSKILRKLKKR